MLLLCVRGIEIKCSFLSSLSLSLLASWPACSSSSLHQGRDAAHLSSMLQRSQVLINPRLPSDDQLLPLHAQQHAGQLPRVRCRTRSRARPCEHRKGASVPHVAHEQLPEWQSLSSSWDPFSAAAISAPAQRIFARIARDFGHSRRARRRPCSRARAADRSPRAAAPRASRARRVHPRPPQL